MIEFLCGQASLPWPSLGSAMRLWCNAPFRASRFLNERMRLPFSRRCRVMWGAATLVALASCATPPPAEPPLEQIAPPTWIAPLPHAGSAVALALFTVIAAVLSVVAGLRTRSFTLGCLTFAGCCVVLTALFLLQSSWLTEAFSAVLSALCLFTPFEEFVNNSFSIPTLVYYLTVIVLFLFFTAQGLEKRH